MIPRRVAYVVNVFPKLSETFITNELAELCRRGVEVRILSLRQPDEELRHEIVAGAGLAERTVYDSREFLPVLQEFRPELLHAHFATKPTATARALAAKLGVPFTFTAHRYDIYARPPADFADGAAAAATVVTVSEANVRYIVSTFGVPAAHIRLIPCGVDTERFRPPDQRRAEGGGPAEGALNSAVSARPESSTRAGQPSAAQRAAIAATVGGSVTLCASPSTTRSNSRVATLNVQRASRARFFALRVPSPVSNQNAPSTQRAPIPVTCGLPSRLIVANQQV